MNAVKCLVMTEQRDRSFIFHTVQSLSAHARDYGSRITTKHVFFGHHFSHECHVFLLSMWVQGPQSFPIYSHLIYSFLIMQYEYYSGCCSDSGKKQRIYYLECLTKTSSSSSGPLSGLLNLTLVNNLR